MNYSGIHSFNNTLKIESGEPGFITVKFCPMDFFVDFKGSPILRLYVWLRYVRLVSARKAGNLAIRTIRLLEEVLSPLLHGPGSELLLPDFLIVGVQKSGTSSLASWLIKIPGIHFSRNGRQSIGKLGLEMHFFSNPAMRLKGLKWYSDRFSPGKVNGEKTPEYLPRRTSMREIRRCCPGAKIVVILRNPVSRAFSAYQDYNSDVPRSRNWDWLLPGKSFEANLWAEEFTRFPMGLLARGRYAEQLEFLLRLFPENQVKVLVLERFLKDPPGHMKELVSFLGGNPDSVDPVFPHFNRGSYSSQLNPDTRRRLAEYYRPHNEKLFKMLGYRIPEWEEE